MKLRAVAGLAFALTMAYVVYVRTREPHPPSRPSSVDITPPPAALTGPVTFPETLVDMEGQTVVLAAAPQRIVSLAPSATELLFDLGLETRVAADTTACDFPKEAALKPHIGGFDNMSLESVLARNPDLVVADGTINVKMIRTLEAAHVPTLVLAPRTLAQTYDAIRLLGRATGQTEQAAQLVGEMQARIDVVRTTLVHAVTRPKVLIAYGTEPIYTTGRNSFIDDVISIAGGVNIVDNNDTEISPERVAMLQPDAILCDPGLIDPIKRIPGWKDSVPAVQNTSFFWVSNAATLGRGTPRLAQAAEELARFLHPELYTSDGRPAPLPAGTP